MKRTRLLRTFVVFLAISLLTTAAIAPTAWAAEGVEVEAHEISLRFTGVIRAVPGAAGEPWVIGGQTLTVDRWTNVVEAQSAAELGMFAEVGAMTLADGSLLARTIVVKKPEIHLRGTVDAKPEEGMGVWTISGVDVHVTEATRVCLRCGLLEKGSWVEVVLLQEPLGSLLVDRMHALETQAAVTVSGAIERIAPDQWVLSSIPVLIDAETLISGEPAIDLIAHAAAHLNAENALVASVLRVAWINAGGMRPQVTFQGVIEALPNWGLIGLWTVNGRTVSVMPRTQISQGKGLAVVGAGVQVTGWQTLGAVVATEIAVLTSPQQGGDYVTFDGAIEALPLEGVTGSWAVAGRRVLVTERTQISGSTPRLGDRARVAGLRRGDGAVLADTIRVTRGGAPRSSELTD